MTAQETTFSQAPNGGSGTLSSMGTNVSDVERWASLLGGGALALYGMKRGDLGGFLLSLVSGELLYRGMTAHCPVYQTLGISTAETGLSSQASVPAPQGIRVDKTVTVDGSPEQLYHYWHNFENLPNFMKHLEAVQVTGE